MKRLLSSLCAALLLLAQPCYGQLLSMTGAGLGASSAGLVVAASAVTDTPTASSSLTINLPSSISAGDLLIIALSIKDNARILTNVPSGFTRIGTVQGHNSGGESAVFYKSAAGSEGATVAMTLGGSSTGGTVSLRITGWTGTPEKTSGSTLDPPSLTPSWGSAATLWLAVGGVGYATEPAITFPTNYTTDNNQSANSYASIGWRLNTAASEDPGTFGQSGGTSVTTSSFTVGIRPL